MIRITEKELKKLEKKEPEFMYKLERKINLLGHMYYKLLNFMKKLGLEKEYIDTLDRAELVEYTTLLNVEK